MNSTAKKFLTTTEPREDALPWLENRPQNDAPDWIRALRDTGADAFARTGLPHPKQEGWQYLNLRSLGKTLYAPAAQKTPDTLPPALIKGAARIVVSNGIYQPSLSTLPEGIRMTSLLEDEALAEDLANPGDYLEKPFKALNAAHLEHGFALIIPDNVEIEVPIEVIFHNSGDAEKPVIAHPRVLYKLGENAGATIIERYTGENHYFLNSVIDLIQAPDSRLKYYRLVDDSAAAENISLTTARLEKDTSFECFSMSIGGRLVRQEIQLQMVDKRVFASINGIYMIKHNQHHDFTVLSDHFEPSCQSTQFFKGVADDQSRAIFQGKIQVRRPAQRTDGRQSHHALLLSGEAEVSAKPELEIYADDVKCAHGATTGQIDPMALFYMRNRGIPLETARAMMIESFLYEVVEKCSFVPMQEVYHQAVTTWLEGRKI